jgi:hypothetical protein
VNPGRCSPYNSLGFPVLPRFCDAQSRRSFPLLHRYLGPLTRTWRCPFHSCGVTSPQAPTPDRESLPATRAQSTHAGPHPRRLAGALGASNSSAPFRNRSEALHTAGPSQSHEPAKVPVLFSPNCRRKPGPKGPSAELIHAVVEMKQRNPNWGCPRTAQQIALERRKRKSALTSTGLLVEGLSLWNSSMWLLGPALAANSLCRYFFSSFASGEVAG